MPNLFALCSLLFATSGAQASDAAYLASVEAWHQGRIERLRSPEGWLSLVGLFRLTEGENRFGSAADNELVFPDKAPAHAGSIVVQASKATLRVNEGVSIQIDDVAVTEALLGTDTDENTSVMAMGSLRFYVIERSDALFLRVKDRQADLIAKFEGIERFPVDPKWNVQARWIPYDPPKSIPFADVLGNVDNVEIPGYLEFELDGTTYTIDPQPADDELFVIFGDATNGEETYGAGRYIYVPVADASGIVQLDFNRAYNPPCIFTPFATCPLPPRGNRLPLRVTAGEKTWGGAAH
jgi:uncharacterized protein (DUF1684 family)